MLSLFVERDNGLQDEVAWEQQEIRVMGRKVMQPRLVAYMADHEGLAYTYSHTKQRVLPWAPSVREIKVGSMKQPQNETALTFERLFFQEREALLNDNMHSHIQIKSPKT